MGACCSTSVASPTLPNELTILVVGLDNSGKTTLVQAIGGNYDTDSIVPTVGFAAPVRRRLFGKNLVFYDLGGGSRIRGVWPQYYAEVHGLVYVVDASDPKRLAESAEELHQAVLHPMVVGKPLLVYVRWCDRCIRPWPPGPGDSCSSTLLPAALPTRMTCLAVSLSLVSPPRCAWTS